MYKIKPYTKQKARNIGVMVKPSTRKGKKIDVYTLDGVKIASVGAEGYKDYPTYLQLESKGKIPAGTARKKQKQYKARHQNNRTKKWSNGWLADQLLW